jgi:5-methylcytosine-specific restriction endonuclease McrA
MTTCHTCGSEKYQAPSGRLRCGPCTRAANRRSYQKHKAKRQIESKEWRQKNKAKLRSDRKKRYQENKEDAKAEATQWARENRERRLEIQRRWYAENREAANAASRAWQAENIERHRETARAWHRKNRHRHPVYKGRRRAREASGPGPSVDIVKTLLRRQKKRCVACDAILTKVGYHLDHIIPLATDGAHEDANLQLLCPTCNRKKGARDPVWFMQSMGFLL